MTPLFCARALPRPCSEERYGLLPPSAPTYARSPSVTLANWTPSPGTCSPAPGVLGPDRALRPSLLISIPPYARPTASPSRGGSRFTYTGVRGYHPLLAVVAGTGEVLHSRLRAGPANTTRGAAHFLGETITRVRGAGASGEVTLRADSGFYAEKVVDVCRKRDVRFSITVRLHRRLEAAIAALPEEAWTPIPYFLPGAGVAETTYTPFGAKGIPVRLIVRRVPPTPGSQLALFTPYTYHAFISDRKGDTLTLEADHRRHAEIENTVRDLKYGVGLNHLPSGKFAANAAWLALHVLAHNLGVWVNRLGLQGAPLRTKTLRRRYLALAGRLTHSARRLFLSLPSCWPWREEFMAALTRLRSLPLLT